jgi:hypothetical protein
VDTLRGMLSIPSRADAEVVALCCLEVAAWARGAGLPHTAVAFAQAGAVAAPKFGEAALHVGLHARGAGQDARAETWLRRAVDVCRRDGDRVAYSSALGELGTLYESRDNALAADRFYRLAYRAPPGRVGPVGLLGSKLVVFTRPMRGKPNLANFAGGWDRFWDRLDGKVGHFGPLESGWLLRNI